MGKKLSLISILVLCLTAICLFSCGSGREQYIRIHIRANSNEGCDQDIKLEVRDAIIAFIAPLAASAEDKKEMMELLSDNLGGIKTEAERVLKVKGFNYNASVKLAREEFPEKTYGELTLEAGSYDALIIMLGSGEGDNWWCVAFPPLCFIPAEDNGTDEVVYKSKIAEWLDKLCD